MAIMAPSDLGIIKANVEPLKKYVLSKLGYPHVDIEITEDAFNSIFQVATDFIAGYFPREQRLAVFYTSPLKTTYPMPSDAYWIQEVHWDQATYNFNDIFSSETYLWNTSYISGMSSIALDYHLLQSYRKFTQHLLAQDGRWEVLNEVDGESGDQLIRLYPTPKGAYPVVVLYIPIIKYFRSPQARQLAYEMMVAEAKISIGHSRRKITGIPTPDGGAIAMDGAELVQEGEKAKEDLLLKAINLGEPMMPYMY